MVMTKFNNYNPILIGVKLPEGVTSIGEEAFSECISLSSIELPGSVMNIGESAFGDCSNLSRVELPEGVTSIGNAAFYGCSSLTSIEVPSSVTSVGRAAFYNCSSLTSIRIPSSVEDFGEYCLGYTEDDEKIPDFTICGYKGTGAETYATENEFKFIALEPSGTPTPQPTEIPALTETPGDIPTATVAPTEPAEGTPTPVPTELPSDTPTVAPTELPSVTPTAIPTMSPSGAPTVAPTATPTKTEGTTVTPTVAVVKPATITAKDITKTYSTKTFSLGAKVDSNGKLTYTSSDTKVATVSAAGKVTLKGYGKTTIIIKAASKGNYKAAQKKIVLTVKPKTMSAPSLKSAKAKNLTVSWKKDTKATGYVLQYSTDKNFKKNVKTVTISKAATTSKKISKLTSKKKYYVRVCAYKKISGGKLTGSYSKAKRVTIK